MTESYPGGSEPFAVHPDAYEVTADGATTYGHYHGGEDMTHDQIKESTADAFGTTPDMVHIYEPGKGGDKTRSVFGFSSAKWRAPYNPAGFPKDPSLN